MIYDLIIIGSGPAGCAASIYASRYGLKNLLLGKTPGGTIAYAHEVDNYPGLWGLSGAALMQKIEAQVKALGAEISYDPVTKIQLQKQVFEIFTSSGKKYDAKTVILACGTERRKLGIPGEKELIGKGVSYCVTCDAPFYKDKTVVLIGGSDAACSGAVHLGQYVKKIYLIYRKSQLRAEPFWTAQWEKLVKERKGEFLGETKVVEILKKNQTQDLVGSVRLNKPYQGAAMLQVDGVFIEIGGVPGVELAEPLGATLDQENYLVVTESGETNIAGLFAAGDMTNRAKIMQQVVMATASGAIAASSAYKYLKGQTAPRLLGV